jgi:hypothetical protein
MRPNEAAPLSAPSNIRSMSALEIMGRHNSTSAANGRA